MVIVVKVPSHIFVVSLCLLLLPDIVFCVKLFISE